MMFQTLNEFIIMSDGFGDSSQDVCIRLHLLIEAGSHVGQVIQSAAEILDERGKIRVNVRDGGIGLAEGRFELTVDISRQEPFTKPSGTIQMGGSRREITDRGPG